MRNFRKGEHPAQRFRSFHGSRTDENGLTFLVGFSYLSNRVTIFFPTCFKNNIIFIDTNTGAMGWDGYHRQTINFVELSSFRFRCTSHTRQLLIHPEIVLNGDGCVCFIFFFESDAFFGFHRLVESITPAAAGHNTSGVFIDDHDLVFLNYIMAVFFVECEGLE